MQILCDTDHLDLQLFADAQFLESLWWPARYPLPDLSAGVFTTLASMHCYSIELPAILLVTWSQPQFGSQKDLT